MHKNIQLGILSGDGIGHEVIHQAKVVLDAVREKQILSVDIKEEVIGRTSIEANGQVFPVTALDLSLDSDAIILGPTVRTTGHNAAEDAIIQTLGAHTRIIPIRAIQELNTVSPLKQNIRQGVSFTIYESITTQMERSIVLGSAGSTRQNSTLTLVGDASIYQTYVQDLDQNNGLRYELMTEDEAVETLMRNPKHFSHIVCDQKMGAIITRIASMIVGSKAVIPSKIVGEKVNIYKPLHGINDDLKDCNTANPIGAIMSLEMCLRDMLATKAADDIKEAVDFCMSYGLMTEDLDPMQSFSTSQIGQMIAVYIQEGRQGLKTRKLNEALSTIV